MLHCPVMPDDPLKDWLTKTEAAAFLRVSEKTIERLATKGHLRRTTRKRHGVRPLPVYNPDDLQKVKDSQTAQVQVVPQAEAGQTQALAPRVDLPSFLQSLVNGADVPLRDKLFLSVKEATRFSGLPESTIRRCSGAGSSPASKRAAGESNAPTLNKSI